MYITTG